MRADIHDGPEHMLQSETGYIDARPLTPARRNLLQRTAGPYIRVKLRRTQYEHMFSGLAPIADIDVWQLRVRWHCQRHHKMKMLVNPPLSFLSASPVREGPTMD